MLEGMNSLTTSLLYRQLQNTYFKEMHFPFSIQSSSQIKDAVPSYLQPLQIHKMNLVMNLLYLLLNSGKATSGVLSTVLGSPEQDMDLLE